jgi:hypothetical protein
VVWEASGYGQKSSDFPIVPTVIVTALIAPLVIFGPSYEFSGRVIEFHDAVQEEKAAGESRVSTC